MPNKKSTSRPRDFKILSQGKVDVIEKDLLNDETKPEIACDAWPNCEDKNCIDCNSRQMPALTPRGKAALEKARGKFPKDFFEDNLIPSGENETTDKQPDVTEKVKAGQTDEKLSDIPAEYVNYRVTLRNLLREKDGLEYRISSLKTQLKAADKAIETLNKEFVSGEYTGELFSNGNSKAFDMAPGFMTKREDGPDFDEFLVLAGESFSFIDEHITSGTNIFHAALLDFVTSNPDSATAKLLYHKVSFVKLEEDDEDYDTFELPNLDDRSDFLTAFVPVEDRVKYNEVMAKWSKKIEEAGEKEDDEKENEESETKAIPKFNRRDR